MRGLCLIAIVGLTGCIVMQPPTTDMRPRWHLVATSQGPVETGCVIGRANIRKSGKQGIGFSLQLKSRMNCLVGFVSAQLEFRDGRKLKIAPPAAVSLPGHSLVYVWWPVAFDNNTAWNDGVRDATVRLAFDASGTKGEWVIGMIQQ